MDIDMFHKFKPVLKRLKEETKTLCGDFLVNSYLCKRCKNDHEIDRENMSQ